MCPIMRNLKFAIAVSLLIGAISAVVASMQWAEALDNRVLDYFFRIRGPRRPSNDIVLVVPDEPSLKWAKQRPKRPYLNRVEIAEAARLVKEAGASVVAITGSFVAPATLPEDEAAFRRIVPKLDGVIVNGTIQRKKDGLPEELEYIRPLSSYGQGLDPAFVSLNSDVDQVVRSSYLSFALNGDRLYPFDVKIAARYLGKTPQQLVEMVPARWLYPLHDKNGPLLRINFLGPGGTFHQISLYKALTNNWTQNRREFYGRIVILMGAPEAIRTPFTAEDPDTRRSPDCSEVLANVVYTLLNGGVRQANGFERALWAAALTLPLLTASAAPARWLLAALPAVLALSAMPYLLFLLGDIWLGGACGALSFGLAMISFFVRRLLSAPSVRVGAAALVVIDMCDSTKLSSKFGDAFATRLKSGLRGLILKSAKSKDLKFYKGTGDGMLLAFTDTGAAVRSCAAFMSELRESNSRAPETERINVRCAVHMGEVNFIYVGGQRDIEGDAANFVCRIEGLKPESLIEDAGGMKPEELPLKNRVLVSEPANDDIRNTGKHKTRYVGFFDLKGIRGRQRIYQLLID